MRKEVIVAIVFGITVGLAVAFGIWRANTAFKTKSQSAPLSHNQTLEQNTQAPNAQNQEFKIILAEPEEKDVVVESPTTVSGITKPNSLVVISGETKDYIIKASENGEFRQSVELSSGMNQILFSAFSQEGQKTEHKVIVVYSTEYKRE